MPLFEYACTSCQTRFEEIVSFSDSDAVACPKCQSAENTHKIVSRFAVGGQGDLRESTMHGCHDHFTGLEHSHDHDHDSGE
jgi:putative FmdB family regulatory protein